VPALQSAFGLAGLLALAWLASENRRAASPAVALTGFGIQLALAALVLKLPPLQALFSALNDAVLALQDATEAGTALVFGYLGGAPVPFQEVGPGRSFILAFQALPLVIVVSALASVLTYWRILPWVVRGFAFALERTMGVGGAVGVACAANIFVGMVEAPLLIRGYLGRLTRSELFVVMCTGMATIAGTVLALYATFLQGVVPGAAGHLLGASVISVPAAITVARLMVPEAQTPTGGRWVPAQEAASTMDAVTRGTQSGLQLFLNILAMLLVLVALVHLVNAALGILPPLGGAPLTLERMLGYAMAPVCWLMGVPWGEAQAAGSLMGTKIVLNELLAYLRLSELPADTLSPRSSLIMTYALCGFANFGSLGILIGGLVTLAPERRDEIVALGPRSIVAGTLAASCTGAVVGIFYSQGPVP